MVSTPAAWRLPNAPVSLGAQIEASFALWVRSARAAFPYSLLYTLSGLLPLVTLGDLGARMLKLAGRVAWFAVDPGQPDPTAELMPLLHALQAWAIAPSTLLLAAGAMALALYGINGVLLHQQRIARGVTPAAVPGELLPQRIAPGEQQRRTTPGELPPQRMAPSELPPRGNTVSEPPHRAAADEPPGGIALRALWRWPRALAAWAMYGGALLACTALVAVFMAALLYAALGVADLGVLAAMLVVLLLGGLLLSVPLAWASVAFGYAPVLATLEGSGPVAAHRASVRLVRGHWARAATVVTVPLLVYLGLGSTVSSLAYTAAGVAAYARGGLPALADGAWLAWVPWLGALPMALGLPLAFSGMLVSLHDLRLRNQAPP